MNKDHGSQDRFDKALKVVLRHEGGFTNNMSDSGGPTNFGISLRFIKASGIDIDLDGEINIEDIKKLNKNNARDIYNRFWWEKYHYNSINNLEIATKIFDLSVNMGAIQAHKLVQRAINSMMPFGLSYIDVDGLLGAVSIKSINDIDEIDESKHLLTAIKSQGAKFYRNLVDKNNNLEIFIKGWMNRLYD